MCRLALARLLAVGLLWGAPLGGLGACDADACAADADQDHDQASALQHTRVVAAATAPRASPGASTGAEGASRAAGPTRFTQHGCICKQEWRWSGSFQCLDSCCNPDNDRQDWCFVADQGCQGKSWGYCRPKAGLYMILCCIVI